LPIIDPHHHVWDNAHGRYLVHELADDVNSGHNVIATVFIEAGSMYRAEGPEAMKPVGEVEFVNGIAAMSASGRYGKTRLCAGIVGHADLMLGDNVQPVLEALIAAGNGRFRGIRHGVIWDTGNAAKFGRHQPPEHLVLDPVFRKGFARLQPLGLSFESWQFHPQLPDTRDLLRSFPETNVILNHAGGLLGIPPHDGNRDEIFAIWRGHMRDLVKFPNLTVKVGGLGMTYCGWDFHLRDIPPSSEELAAEWRPYVETCIELFGADRCMMESNFPVDKESTGYGVLWNALKRITQNYSAADKEALYRNTAARVYRLAV
jgi:L-fuconolactonase